MRAAEHTEHGDPDVLRVVDRDPPEPGPDQVRIAVRAAGVNPVDWKLVSGAMADGPLAGPTVPGIDAAGVVDAVGDGADAAIGDEVFGFAVGGAAAERAVLAAWAPRPATLSWEEAAAFPVAVETTIRILHLLELRRGATLLVDGGAGGVGQALLQVAAARGLRTIATASEGNHDRLRALGAEPTRYGDGLAERVRALAPGGVDGAADLAGQGSVAVLAELTGDPARVVTIADFSGAVPGVQVTTGGELDRAAALREAADLAAGGALRLPVADVYPLDQIAEAYRRSRDGHVAGKLVLVVGEG